MTVPEDSLLKFDIPEVIYGLGALSQIGKCGRRLGGERILLVTDPGLIDAGWVDESIKYLSEEDLQFAAHENDLESKSLRLLYSMVYQAGNN